MATVEHHVHANTFGKEDAEVIDTLAGLGFSYKPCHITQAGQTGYFGLFTFKAGGRLDKESIHDRALQALSTVPGFTGYVESEVTGSELHRHYEFRTYDASQLLPVGNLTLVHKPKEADIHIYIPGITPRGTLDDRLEASGFFEVQTPNKRIFTLEFELASDAKAAFQILHSHFDTQGGVMEVEFEKVTKLQAVTPGLQFRAVVASGALTRATTVAPA